MFKLLIPAIVVALTAPSFAFAQQNAPVTRAQVKAELVQLEKAGYNPASDGLTYPAQLRDAETRLVAENGQSSYGRVADGSSASANHAPGPAGVESTSSGD